jgi:hypothetical protein
MEKEMEAPPAPHARRTARPLLIWLKSLIFWSLGVALAEVCGNA